MVEDWGWYGRSAYGGIRLGQKRIAGTRLRIMNRYFSPKPAMPVKIWIRKNKKESGVIVIQIGD